MIIIARTYKKVLLRAPPERGFRSQIAALKQAFAAMIFLTFPRLEMLKNARYNRLHAGSFAPCCFSIFQLPY